MRVELQEVLIALSVIVIAMILGRVATTLSIKIGKRMRLSQIKIRRALRLFRVGLFLLSLVIALGILRVSFAQTLWVKILEFLPSFFVLVILWLLGYAVISLIIDLVAHALLLWADEYLKEFGVTERTASAFFSIAKIFLLLIFAAVSLKVADLSLPIIDWVIVGLVFSFMIFAVAVAIYAFKDHVANFLLSTHVAKNVLKPGQYVRVDGEVGEVVSITNHGATLIFPSGYKLLIPNASLIRDKIMLKRIRSDIHKLEPLLRKYIVQLPSNCGPASAAMMLNFFSYNFTQSEIAKYAKTKVRVKKAEQDWTQKFGTEPQQLIEAVRKLTKNQVKGKLIMYDEIDDLKEEVKVWLTEGALPILWYMKPILFPEKKSKTGHFVLAVGVEDDSIIVMDPSSQTSGVYMVNYELMAEAMAQHDRKRGYVVFAKKGSPAFWRLTEKLYYSDADAYERLGKSFERYLKKTIRESGVVREFISPFVELFFEPDEEKIKHLWKPNLGTEERKSKRNA